MQPDLELENFIRSRFGDLLVEGDLELLYQPGGFETLKSLLSERARTSSSATRIYASA